MIKCCFISFTFFLLSTSIHADPSWEKAPSDYGNRRNFETPSWYHWDKNGNYKRPPEPPPCVSGVYKNNRCLSPNEAFESYGGGTRKRSTYKKEYQSKMHCKDFYEASKSDCSINKQAEDKAVESNANIFSFGRTLNEASRID